MHFGSSAASWGSGGAGADREVPVSWKRELQPGPQAFPPLPHAPTGHLPSPDLTASHPGPHTATVSHRRYYNLLAVTKIHTVARGRGRVLCEHQTDAARCLPQCRAYSGTPQELVTGHRFDLIPFALLHSSPAGFLPVSQTELAPGHPRTFALVVPPAQAATWLAHGPQVPPLTRGAFPDHLWASSGPLQRAGGTRVPSISGWAEPGALELGVRCEASQQAPAREKQAEALLFPDDC